jgi:hypothetical protein
MVSFTTSTGKGSSSRSEVSFYEERGTSNEDKNREAAKRGLSEYDSPKSMALFLLGRLLG